MIQLSLDGPNVRLKFLDLINENCNDNEPPGLNSIGTCGLHTIHGAFQYGAKIWSVGKVLQAIWKIIHESPSWCADYENVTNSTIYPLIFCQHRWVEHVNMAIGAESIWDNFVKLLK